MSCVDGPVAHAALFHARALGAGSCKVPQRPGRALGARSSGGFGMILKLSYLFSLLPVASAQAIGYRVAAADDHHVFARGQNLDGGLRSPSRCACSVAGETPWQSECPSFPAPARANRALAFRRRRSATRHQTPSSGSGRHHVMAHMCAHLQADAFGRHLLDAPIQNVLFQL